ncbi:hypothetical protein [Granulicoccus phenolivorans]|uniref:hypothetical protein n=1 Tax=Granulicoccus phenolivorans TaxID=266854 RepID=UPI000418CECB|nr:hypothetical protein [Granulicoccus phenolivorans]
MTPQPHDRPLTPYDTGERAEPQVWSTPTRLGWEHTAAEGRRREADRFGKVDFDAAAGDTCCTVWVETGPDGPVVHLQPLATASLGVVVHGPDGRPERLRARLPID